MKEGWVEKRLGDVCNIASMLVDPRKDEFLDLAHVGAGNIETQTGILIELKTAREEGLISGKFLFDESMVLYSKIRPYLMKVVRPEFSGMCSADIYPLTPLPSEITRDYLFYLLLSKHFTDYAIEGSARAGMPKVNRDHLFDFRVCLPDVEKQKELTSKLDDAFDGIATAKANAEQNLRNARELFESHLQAVFTQRGEGWVETTIGQHIRFIDYRGKTPEKTQGGLRLITAKNVKVGYLQEAPMEYVAPESYDAWMTRGIPRCGDVLFTTEAPLANVAQLDTEEKVVFAQRIIIMQPDTSKIDSTFLKYLLLSRPVQQRIHAQGTGATVKGIKASLLKLIPISFPHSLTEQRQIVSKLDELAAETQHLEAIYQQKLAALDELKKSLLHKAFSGEL